MVHNSTSWKKKREIEIPNGVLVLKQSTQRTPFLCKLLFFTTAVSSGETPHGFCPAGCNTLKAVLRVVYDPDAPVGYDGLTGRGIPNVRGQLVPGEFGLMDGAREVEGGKDLVDAVVLRVQAEDDALHVVSVLLEKPANRPCKYKKKRNMMRGEWQELVRNQLVR